MEVWFKTEDTIGDNIIEIFLVFGEGNMDNRWCDA